MWRSLIIFLIAETFAFYFAITRLGSAGFAFVIVGMTMIPLALGQYQGRRRAKRQLTSYTVTLDGEHIRRVIAGMADIEVKRAEVTAIEERRPGGLSVYGRDRRFFVGVNDQVEGYDAIRNQLSGWRPFDEKRPAKFFVVLLVSVLTVVAFAVTILSHDRLVVASVGSALAIALIVCGLMIFRSPHVDRKTKRATLFMLLPLGAIVARVAVALFSAHLP